MMTAKNINIDGIEQTIYVGKDVTALYSGLQKATYALIFWEYPHWSLQRLLGILWRVAQ